MHGKGHGFVGGAGPDETKSEIAQNKMLMAIDPLAKLLPFAESPGALGKAYQIALMKANAAAKDYIDANPGLADA